MKATTAKKILIGTVAALCVTTIAGVTALAVYTNRQLNAENTLTVGKEVDTVVISGGEDVEEPIYPGDSRTITYNVQIDKHDGTVTASWELTNEEDFTIVVKQGDTTIEENTTALVLGELTFTITMNGDTEINSAEEIPDYDSVTLKVTLNAD